MDTEPFFDFYHDHPYHQLNIGQEVEVVHEDIAKKFIDSSSSSLFDKKVFKDVINKGFPIPKEWLDAWKNITVQDLKPYVDIDVIFKNWDAVLPTIKKDTRIPKLLSPRSRVRERSSEPIRKSILLTPSQLPDFKIAKKWEIKCVICHKMLRGGNKRYEAHMKNTHQVRCLCGQEFQSKMLLRSHLKKEINQSLHGFQPAEVTAPLFECDICDEIFRSLALAEKHRQMAHNIHNYSRPVIKAPTPVVKPIVFNCRSCKLQLKDRASLLNHHSSKACVELKKKIFKYYCSVCHKGYHCKKTCREHLKKIHNIRSRAEVFVKHINKDKPPPIETQTEGSQQIPCEQQRRKDDGPLLPMVPSHHVSSTAHTNDLPTHTKAGSVIYYSLARSRYTVK